MLISDGGTLVRTRASEVATTGRNAQGVRLIRLGNEEILVGVVSVEAVEEDDFIEEVEGETLEVEKTNVNEADIETDVNPSEED